MKTFSLKKYIPGTMYAQIFLALFVGIFSLYLFMSYYIISMGRAYTSTYLIGDRSRFIYSYYTLIRLSSAAEREQLAINMKATGYSVEFANVLPEKCCGSNPQSEAMAEYIKSLALGSGQTDNLDVHVTVTEFDYEDYFLFIKDVLFGNDTLSEHIIVNEDYKLKVAIPLDENTWAIFEGNGYNLLIPHTGSLAVPLLIFGLVAVFGFVIVYFAVQPLKRLAHATEEFSRNLTHFSPMIDEGPTEVRDTIIAFNLMQKRIFDFINERSRLLAAISHDLRTPLTRIALRAEQLEEPISSSFMKDINQLRQLMDTSIEIGRATANTEKFVVVDVISLLDSMAEDFASSGHHVDFTRENIKSVHKYNRVPPIAIRLLCLKRALLNVLENAKSYGTYTQIFVNDTLKDLTIEIVDNGSGIPEDKLEKVFEPFFRLEPSRNRATGGTGLGLAIARSMLQLCDGDIFLKNNEGKGTTAVIKLLRHR